MNDGSKLNGGWVIGAAAAKPARPALRSGLNRKWLPSALLLFVAVVMAALAVAPTQGLSPTGDLRLLSTPPGASVFVSGRLAGLTPITIQSLRVGTYGLRMEKDGFAPVARNVTLTRAGALTNEKLEALRTVHMTVDVKPLGAEVFMDGELQGHTPLDLDAVPVGSHDLVIRKTNFDSYFKQIEVTSGQPLVFRGFELDDKVLQMLNSNILKEPARVAHHMDLGHYLFVNDHLNEAAVAYSKALEVSATPLEFAKESPPEEQKLLERLRHEDRSRLGSQISMKEGWPGKDVSRFNKTVEGRRHELNEQHIKEWWWISEQAGFYSSVNRLDEAQTVLLHYMDVNKGQKDYSPESPNLTLLNVRLKIRKLDLIRESCNTMFDQFQTHADLMRQAGDAVFQAQANAEAKDRPEMLKLAERFFAAGAEHAEKAKAVDTQTLCEFQLGITLAQETDRLADAIAAFRKSIEHTKELATKEQRSLKLAEVFRTQRAYEDARNLLNELSKSPREAVASKAKLDLKELASVEAASKTK